MKQQVIIIPLIIEVGILLTLASLLTPVVSQCTISQPCNDGSCCSQYGFCGYGPDFCGPGCQADCEAKPDVECGLNAAVPECPLKVCCSTYGFCGLSEDFCLTGCQSNCQLPVENITVDNCHTHSTLHAGVLEEPLHIGYYASWSAERSCRPFAPENIDPRLYTHLNYAFGNISQGLMIIPEANSKEFATLKGFCGLKALNPEVKLQVSVGGWEFNDPGPTQDEFHNIISTSENRTRFIQSVAEYLDAFDLDGIDIDYEYPGADDRGGSPEDSENFLQLVKEMRDTYGPNRYLITIAAPASYWYLRHFKIGEMSKYLDWINVMSYDFAGSWGGQTVASHTDMRQVNTALDLYLRDGVPRDKLVLGLAYYGRSFKLENSTCTWIGCPFSGAGDPGPCTKTPGTLTWFEIADLVESGQVTIPPSYDPGSGSMTLTWPGDNNSNTNWIAYDNRETLELKKEFVSKNCLKGQMIWSIDQGLEYFLRDGDSGCGMLMLWSGHLTNIFILGIAFLHFILDVN